jgi:hypothetical protein
MTTSTRTYDAREREPMRSDPNDSGCGLVHVDRGPLLALVDEVRRLRALTDFATDRYDHESAG